MDDDEQKMESMEEVVYQTAHAVETVIQLMIDKGFFTEQELINKMEELSEQEEDDEELSHDADAPRDQD